MAPRASPGRRLLRGLLGIAVTLCILWGVGALWFQAPLRWLWLPAWSRLTAARKPKLC